MKKISLLASLSCFLSAVLAGAAERPAPNAAQMKRIREGVEIYGIVHWGLNTYTDREWGFGDENPADLNPTKVDPTKIPFNVIVMREDVERGEQVDDWRLEVGGRTVASGKSIGIKRIRILDAPVSGPWKLVANRGTHPVDVKSDFYAADPELVNLVRSATADSGETDTAKWMTAMINCRQID